MKEILILAAAVLTDAVCANAQAAEGPAGIPIEEDLDEAEGWPKSKMVRKCHIMFYKALCRDLANKDLFPDPPEALAAGAIGGLAGVLPDIAKYATGVPALIEAVTKLVSTFKGDDKKL